MNNSSAPVVGTGTISGFWKVGGGPSDVYSVWEFGEGDLSAWLLLFSPQQPGKYTSYSDNV